MPEKMIHLFDLKGNFVGSWFHQPEGAPFYIRTPVNERPRAYPHDIPPMAYTERKFKRIGTLVSGQAIYQEVAL